jgi:hypothetical protein
MFRRDLRGKVRASGDSPLHQTLTLESCGVLAVVGRKPLIATCLGRTPSTKLITVPLAVPPAPHPRVCVLRKQVELWNEADTFGRKAGTPQSTCSHAACYRAILGPSRASSNASRQDVVRYGIGCDDPPRGAIRCWRGIKTQGLRQGCRIVA